MGIIAGWMVSANSAGVCLCAMINRFVITKGLSALMSTTDNNAGITFAKNNEKERKERKNSSI